MHTRLRCQQIFLRNIQCPRSTFRNGQLCRWHQISQEFRADFRNRGQFFSRLLILGAGSTLFMAGFCLWRYATYSGTLWLFVAAWAIGLSLMLFADAIMALDYPFSLLVVWPQLLAVGIVLDIVGGFSTSLYLINHPAESLPMVRWLTSGKIQDAYAPALVASVAIIFSASIVKMLFSRILYFNSPMLQTMLWPLVIMMIVTAFRPTLQLLGMAPTSQQSEGFWMVVVGDKISQTLLTTQIIAFSVCELINAGIRRRRCDKVIFKKTVWPSFPVCIGSPFVAMLASRFILAFAGVKSPYAFGLLAVVLSIPICIITTNWVINHATQSWQRDLSDLNNPDEW